jgi:hypothetical protein
MIRTAEISACGQFRPRLTRTWDTALPVLLVVMFNPSTADAEVDDQTVSLVCAIAAHHGYGGIVVMNAIHLRSTDPAPAIAMARCWDEGRDWQARGQLQENAAVIAEEVGRAGAVLIAWGNLGAKCSSWMETVLGTITDALPLGVPLYCLGKTKAGHPKHPMARGKHKVPKDAPLLLWRAKA